MRRIVSKSLLAVLLFLLLSACTLFSVGPLSLELRYQPSATPTPLPSPIPVATNAPPSSSASSADLAISELTINTPDGQPTCDTVTSISLTITNNGNAASIETIVRVMQIGQSRLRLFNEVSATVPMLEPGASHGIAISLPLHTTPDSTYSLRAVIDQQNAMIEANEQDNEQGISLTVICGAAPDLRITDLALGAVNCEGATLITYNTFNEGSARVFGSMTYVNVVGTEMIIVMPVAELGPGESAVDQIEFALGELPDGDYLLQARADASNTVAEADESDNTTEIPFTIACD